MITTLQPALSRCAFLEAIADASADLGCTAIRDMLRGASAPMDLGRARLRAVGLSALLAGEWAPDALEACGVPEDVAGQLRLMGATIELMGATLGDVFAEVHDIDAGASETDYSAYWALSDAKWVIDCAQMAVAWCAAGVEFQADGKIREAVEAYESAAAMVARAAANKTAPMWRRLTDWVSEEIAQ